MTAPGCFGSPTVVSALAISCRSCPHAAGCLVEAAGMLDQMGQGEIVQRARLTLAVTSQALLRTPPADDTPDTTPVVEASRRGVQRLALTVEQLAFCAQLPARVGSKVRTLMERGWYEFARSELAAGRNPAPKDGWLKVTCQLLLAGKPFNRAELQQCFVTQLDLSPASAKVQASLAISTLAAGRLVSETAGQITVVPT